MKSGPNAFRAEVKKPLDQLDQLKIKPPPKFCAIKPVKDSSV